MYKEKTLSLIDAERAILKETIDLFFFTKCDEQ